MNEADALDIVQYAIWTVLTASGPAVGAAQDPLTHAGPYSGFRVDMNLGPLGLTSVSIHGGRIYVDGQLLQTEGTFDFTRQPFCPNLKLPSFGPPSTSASLWIVYLDTFEREVTVVDGGITYDDAVLWSLDRETWAARR